MMISAMNSARTTSTLNRLLLAATLLAALFSSLATGQERFTVEDFVTLPMVGGGAISPDGQKIAWHRTVRDMKKNTYLRQVHWMDLTTGQSRELTREPGQAWGPMWTPDGKGLAFYSTRSGKSELYLNRFDGSDPELLVKSPVAHAVFSPDGRKIAFLAAPKKDPKRPGFGKDPEVWTSIEDPTGWPQLWVIDLDSQKRTQLTDGTTYVYDFDWHPDGQRLAFTFDPEGSEGLAEDHALGVIDLEGKVRVLGSGPVKYAEPRWSPDGRRLAYYRDRAEELDVYLTVKDIWVLDLETDGPRLNLTQGWSGNPTGRLASGGGDRLHWSPDGESIWFVGAERANLNVYRVATQGEGAVEAITPVTGEISNLSFDRAFVRMAFSWTDFTHPADIFVAPAKPTKVAAFHPDPVTHVRDRVKKLDLRMPERITWKSFDGTEVEGFLFLPRVHDQGQPVPVMFDAHGGPAYRWGNAFSYRYMWHVFADHGFGSLIFNPRGSTGYGEAFQRGNFKGMGQGDFRDLMAGVDTLLARGVTAPDRIGMTGYSYGGYLTNLAVSHTDRFKAAVTIAGAFNFVSAMGQSNSILPRAYYHPLASPENLRLMFEHSPVASSLAIKTPTLVIHGKNDTAVHYMQAVEMFTTLQLLKVPSKMILYPGEGHGINRPSHMRHYLEQSVLWLQKYLPGWKEAGGTAIEPKDGKKKDAGQGAGKKKNAKEKPKQDA